MQTRPNWLIVTVALAALAVVVGVGAWLATSGDEAAVEDTAVEDTAVADTAVADTAPSTTTSLDGAAPPDAELPPAEVGTSEVERVELPVTVHEFVTARPEVDVLAVRADPPPRWGVDLTPVVHAAGPAAPRSDRDEGRARLPRPEFQLAGRNAMDRGWIFSNPGAFEPPQPLVLGVVERQGRWIQVQLPVRPNGTTGWVHEAQVVVSSTTVSIEVSLGAHRLRVLRSGVEVFSAAISAGKPSTPTPTGTFHVTDIVPSLDPAGGYGPVALALDGYSEVLDTFAGESAAGSPDEFAPVLAIHGTDAPESIGRDLSNGCPRLFNEDMVQLADLVPPGTRVQIWP